MKSINRIIAFGVFFLVIGMLFLFSERVDPQASMDASYYHILANRVANGKGFTEPFVWHHLNTYSELTHPVDYWMPLGIILYAAAEKVAGANSQVWLNIIIWAFLSAAVYLRVCEEGDNHWAALTAAVALALCGRMMFYLLTTDNIAFYALLGFSFISSLANREDRYASPFLGGLATLMRIEGLIFSALGFFIKCFQHRNLRLSIGYAFIFLLVLAPWMIRNLNSIDTFWPSNSKALFMRSYDDFFCEKFPGTPEYFFELGWKKIIEQKVGGLANSFLHLFAVPGLFVFYPFWFAGIAASWKKDGRIFSVLWLFLWLMCGLLFTHQAERGTALHISAFFLPHFAVFLGKGLTLIVAEKIVSPKIARLAAIILVIWSAIFTNFSVDRLSKEYNLEKQPYERLLAGYKPEKNENVVSINPIFVYLLSGNQGAISGAIEADRTISMADRFSCTYILLDLRTKPQLLDEKSEWDIIASESPLLLYRRNSKN